MNEIITIEIHHHKDDEAMFGHKNEFFNFRVAKVKKITDRQRRNFIKKEDNNTGNTNLTNILTEIEDKIKEITK